MTDELLLALSDMADISPKKVRLIINAYEKAKPGYKLIPEGYTTFKYAGNYYAYKSLGDGDGSWTPECATLELMRVLRDYFISSGKMKKEGHWPGSSYYGAWTSDVDSYGYHAVLYSNGETYEYSYDGDTHARFAVLPLDSERKNF